MQIVERYLESVKNCLPKEQVDDIIKELSENISSQIEDKEAELGRSLTESEVEAILKQHGHPLLVASRYRHEQRNFSFGEQIVGPALFPFYIRVLKFNLGLTSLVVLIIFAALFAAGQRISTLPEVLGFQLLIQFAIVTLIFWAMDKRFTRFPDKWDPRKPYGIRHPAEAVPLGEPRISRTKSISQFVGLLVGLLWLRLVRQMPVLIFGPAAAFLSPSSFWNQFYGPLVALILFGLIQAGISVARPDWVRLHYGMRVATRLGGLALCYFVLRAGSLIVVDPGAGPGAQRVAQIVNQTVTYSILFTVVISIIRLVTDVRKLLGAMNAGDLVVAQEGRKS